MKRLGWALLVLAAVVVYLNIGWAIGTYLHQNTPHTDNGLTAPTTTMAKILAGTGYNTTDSLETEQIVLMILWPVYLVASAICWVIASPPIAWILKLIFAGGLVKLLGGLGNLLTALVLIICAVLLLQRRFLRNLLL